MFNETENDLKENLHQERKENQENRKELRQSRARNRAKNVVIAILLVTTLFGAYQYNRAVMLRRKLDNAYNRAFYELVGYVQNVELMLMKARMTSSPELTATTLNDVWREATAATSNLNQLPISMGVLTNTEKFLSQVADLSRTIAKQNSYGIPINDEQMETLAKLHTFAVTLEESLSDLQSDLNNGNLKWEKVANEKMEEESTTDSTDQQEENTTAVAKETNNKKNGAGNTNDNTKSKDANGANNGSEADKEMQEANEKLPNTFSSINEGFEEMPTLIYDGPYSEHLQNRKALGLTGKKITEEQAIEKLKNFIKDNRIKNISKLADNNNGIINTYNFKMDIEENGNKNVAEADVSVIGGHIVWFLYNREVGEAKIDIEEAIKIGKKFLSDRGYPDMKDSYYLRNDGVATINYAYTKDGITYYPDLIKVKVALDNGEIVGFESNGYLMNHRDRNLGAPQITQAQAREKIKRGDRVSESGLAVIPTDYGSEILCYEFTGKLGDRDFLVYINANTGAEEDVLIIINSEEGILTR